MSRPGVTYRSVGSCNLVKGFKKLFPCCAPKKDRAYLSKKCDARKINVNQSFRDLFTKRFVYGSDKIQSSGHSHARAANDRRLAELSIRNFITQQGFEPYAVSPSARDFKAGIDCNRLYYSPKDLDQPYANTKINPNHVLYMIDVDYYANMEKWLLYGNPILLYTMIPNSVGGMVPDGSYHFEDDKLCLTMNGGAKYEHLLWDYGLDFFIVTDQKVGWSVMVKVDQLVSPLDSQRRIVCLTPTTWYPSKYNRPLFGTVPTLSRFKVKFGDVNILINQTAEKDGTSKVNICAGFNGTPTSLRLRYDLFIGICKRLSLDKHPAVATVERYLNVDKIPDAGILAPIIFDAYSNGWFSSKYSKLKSITHAGVARTSAPHYQALEPLLNDDGRQIGTVISKPLIDGAGIFPCESFNNDTQAIRGRVENIRNNKEPNNYMRKLADEFIRSFPNGVAYPLSESEVIEEQTKPLQKVRSEQNKHWLRDSFVVKAFMKKESYPKATDPRNISTCPPAHTIKLSRYTYAIKEVLKQYPWFIPAHTPTQIVEKLREFVTDSDEVLETDYSRLDGTISEFLRMIERGVYLRICNANDRPFLSQLLEDEYNCKAWTATGVKYDPGFSRLSGSPLTTDGNTLITAFVVYAAARRQNYLRAFNINRIPTMAYGDDGITKCISAKNLELTAKQLGLTLKCVSRKAGTPVTFLARVFVDPWSTETSVQDPARSLGKIHLSSIKNAPNEVVAVNKANGYLTTDPLTPILSQYCRNICNTHPQVTSTVIKKYKLDSENWWVNNFADSWPQHDYDIELMRNVVGEALHLSPSEVIQYENDVLKGKWKIISLPLPATIPVQRSNSAGDIHLERPVKSSDTKSI